MNKINNDNLKRLQKGEALNRLISLNLHENVINEFLQGYLYYSERTSERFDGMLYYVYNEGRFVNAIKEFEEKTGHLVYHAQLTHFVFGDCLTLLSVSNDKNEWEGERNDLKEGYPYCYVINLDDSNCSEWGTVGIAPCNGGVSRTA